MTFRWLMLYYIINIKYTDIGDMTLLSTISNHEPTQAHLF